MAFQFFCPLSNRTYNNRHNTCYRVRNYRGRVSNFDQSEARKQCFLASDSWLYSIPCIIKVIPCINLQQTLTPLIILEYSVPVQLQH